MSSFPAVPRANCYPPRAQDTFHKAPMAQHTHDYIDRLQFVLFVRIKHMAMYIFLNIICVNATLSFRKQ